LISSSSRVKDLRINALEINLEEATKIIKDRLLRADLPFKVRGSEHKFTECQ